MIPNRSAEQITEAAILARLMAESRETTTADSGLHDFRPKLRAIAMKWPESNIEPIQEPSKPPLDVSAATSGLVSVHCEVQIHQRDNGKIQAIDFGVCTGDSVWQQRLLRNLQSAAALVTFRSDGAAPPARTLTFDTDAVSPQLLAEQLEEAPPA